MRAAWFVFAAFSVGLAAAPSADAGCRSSEQLGPSTWSEFSIIKCTGLPPGTFSLFAVAGLEECDLGPQLRIAGVGRAGVPDARLELRRGEELQSLEINPRSRVFTKMGSTRPPIACDSEAVRFYYANTRLGYVVAFDSKARELWRQEIPGFVTIDSVMAPGPGEPVEVDLAEYTNVMDTKAQAVTKLSLSGPYLAVETLSRDAAFRQYIYHRSGKLITVLGPWDGIIERPVAPAGWEFAAGGVASVGTWRQPVERVELQLRGLPFEGPYQHFIASLLPHPTDTRYVYRTCEDYSPDALAPAMGPSYARDDARLALEVRRKLGVTFLNRMIRYKRLSTMMDAVDPKSAAWLTDFKKAFLEAGADIEFARALDTKLAERAATP